MKASLLKISGKILPGTVTAAGIFLHLPPLDQAEFWICDASGWDTHSERWRLEIKPPATISTCSTEGRQSQVSFSKIDICGDRTVEICCFLNMLYITSVSTFEPLGFAID